MIEIGNHPGGIGAVMLHSTESGQFLACERTEFERLAAAIKRGDLDAFLGRRDASAVADGSADWTASRYRAAREAHITELDRLAEEADEHDDSSAADVWRHAAVIAREALEPKP